MSCQSLGWAGLGGAGCVWGLGRAGNQPDPAGPNKQAAPRRNKQAGTQRGAYTMDVPECDKLKAKYDKCYDEWKQSKVVDVQLGGLHVCTGVFDDYRDCVVEGMKHRVAESRRKRQEPPTPTPTPPK